MAYTIISQNNNTTTLTDGVNTITVPSRVNLTSGNFTIVEVNNNMATLEDGDGNVYRDIPCVATLAGEGGGGGTVDKSKIVNADTIPTASASNAGYVYLYTGTTNASYTHGYVYQNVKSATYTGTVSFEAATLSGTTVACSGDNFATFLTEAGADPTPIVSGTMTYEADATGWRLVGKDSDGNTVTTFMEYVEDYQDAGFTFTGTPQDGDVIAFTCSVTEASATYTWTRIDVQPQASGLPDQTGHSGEFLTTDGTGASWTNYQNRPFTNTATKYDCVGIKTSTISDGGEHNILIGSGISSNPRNGRNSNGYAVAIGGNSGTVKVGAHGVAIGSQANFSGGSFSGYDLDNCVAIGFNSYTRSEYSIAIGSSAGAKGFGSIQLGYGENTNARTLSVGWVTSTSPWAAVNYELLSSDGTIPTARLTKVNSTITLTSADWSGGSQTVTVSGMTTTGVVLVSPDPTDQAAYTSAGILCTAQAADSLTFTCSTTPSADIDVNVVML